MKQSLYFNINLIVSICFEVNCKNYLIENFGQGFKDFMD